MAKIRVYELARELKIESKLLMNTLKTIGVSVASHQSTLSGDEIEKVKKAMTGEAVAPTPGKPVLARKGGSVVVRRRRRGSPEQEDKAADASVAQDATAPEKPAEEKVAEKPSEPESTEETSVRVGQPAARQEEEKAADVQVPSSLETKEEQKVDAVKSAEETPEPEDEAASTPKPISKKRSVGATIVRKATPEEVQKSRQQAEAKRRTRREDSKGTKYTGVGSDSGQAPDPAIDVASAQSEEGRGQKRRTKEKKRSETVTEDEVAAAARKAQAQKQKRGGLNVRMLLNQLDDDEGDGDTIETPYGTKQRTVYTPNAAQRRRDLKRRKDLKKTEITVARAEKRVVHMGSDILVGDLAKQLKIKAGEVIKKLMAQGMMVTINQPIDFDTASLIASEFNYEVKSNLVSLSDIIGKDRKDWAEIGTETRPPIVTVMGHVDHGKTSILDAIRQADVATGEAGGITQHIGAYAIVHNEQKIAFLDTPGHEAFSSMRARGANATDIVVLVVAADDGVMPQTVEAISHAKDAGVPIIVAVNKMDKENINVDRVYTELTEHGIQSEEWGGETQFVKVSAMTKMGIDELLEAILLQAEILDLKTESNVPADGVVVEAHLDQGRGPVATVMVKHGTLKIGDYLVAGKEYGRIRAMHDHKGLTVTAATPATPVEVIGLSGVPEAGDVVNSVADEKTAREASEWRAENSVKRSVKSSAQSLEDLLGKMQTQEAQELPIIIKADTQGSVEAICESLAKVNTDQVRNKVVHRAVGGISESDITLAEASGSVIIGFNVRAARGLDDDAEKRGVLIKYFSVIYDLVDAVKNLMAGQLPPIREEVVIGKAEVRQPISVPKIGTIAGSAVIDGKITRAASLRLIRDDIVIYEGKIGSLRRFKDDVKEVKSGYECGIGFENYNDIKIGDVIEAYEIHETRPTL